MLTQDQITAFGRDGYLVVEGVLDQQTVLDPLRREYEALLDGLYDRWYRNGKVAAPPEMLDFESKLRVAYAAACYWFQPMDISLPGDRIAEDTPMHFGPAVFDMITNARLLDLVEDLIGSEITSNPIQHVRIKPPAPSLRDDEARAHVTYTDWHQDRAVALEEADNTRMITVWIAVTDATVENGCLQVIPNTTERMLPHCPKMQTAIADGFIDESRAVPLPVGSGGVVILDPMIPHASLTNTTEGIRWSFDLRYNVSGEPTGRPHFPEFIARSKSAPDTALSDWRAWKQNWEDARARLADQPHIELHRWTSDAPHCA